MASWKMAFLSGAVWSNYYTIEAPTNPPSITMNSNRHEHKLYNGGKARVIPTTKYLYENTSLEFSYISGESILVKSKTTGGDIGLNKKLSLQDIMSSGLRIKLATHTLYNTGVTTTSQVWEGYISTLPKVYKLGMFKNSYGQQSEFYDLTLNMDLISIT